MLKNLITRINNFIQWTKKWHFFHLLLVPNAFACFLICLIMFKYVLLLKEYYSSLEILIVFFVISYFATTILIIIALCIQAFLLIYNWIKFHNINIKNRFLLNNKLYNILYVIAFIYNFLCFLSFICFMILSIFTNITTF